MIKLSTVFAAMEAGHTVVLHIRDRYPLYIRLNDCNMVEERICDCWYPMRKAVNTLSQAWKMRVILVTNERK